MFVNTEVKEVLANKGERIFFNCEFNGGRPKPIVNWMFNETFIRSNDKYSTHQYNTLEIKETRKEDSGVYTCILSNGYHPQKILNFTLKVLGDFYCSVI